MRSFRRPALVASSTLAACSLVLGACSSSTATGAGPAAVDEGTSFTVLIQNENPTLSKQLDTLAQGACADANKALPLAHEGVAQADVVQKITLLASQGALPNHFVAGTAQVRPTGDLGKAGVLVDYEKKMTELGIWDNVSPAAAATVKGVYGQMVSLPYQYNIEGVWYNKKIFSDNGISTPATFDDLVAAMAKLKTAGVVPITEGGQAGWPLTRLMGMYIFRNVGPNAMADVRDGKAKLTDPAYVAGAKALADLGTKGYFGDGVTSRTADAATAQFLTGKAAMTYNGSWMLSNINDPKQNTIGVDTVGFMPFPTVSGGKGTTGQWAANAGTAMAMNSKTFGPKSAAWLTCIAKNYGKLAADAGQISGLKANGSVTSTSSATKTIQDTVGSAKESVLWFEALMDSKSNALASTNVALLVSGQMSPADYMSKLQASLDANK
ncbi:MAG TPA: extracellular solute-binding protein [Propionibacteriaceae bacterium]|nr:extracellular solute-binding protein [Propionibacteriaceae bacterium]